MHLVAALLLVVLALHVLELARKPFNFILVLIDLSLVHVELSSHSLHLVGLFLQILLVDAQLLGHFWTWLTSQQVLQLNIELLLLLYKHIFFYDLFCLLDQALLQGLDLL